MNTVVISTTLFLTIVFALIFGIFAGYAAVMVLLRALGTQSRARVRPAPAPLATMHPSSASGD